MIIILPFISQLYIFDSLLQQLSLYDSIISFHYIKMSSSISKISFIGLMWNVAI